MNFRRGKAFIWRRALRRDFRPDLEGKPVVVLSNNDGCVVARSNEAKSMGIKTAYDFAQKQFEWVRAVFSNVAGIVGVFLNTNPFRNDLDQYANYKEIKLLTPSNSTITITKAANDVLQSIFRKGFSYKKAGVILADIVPDSPVQQDMFDLSAADYHRLHRLDAVIDHINKINGDETVVLGSQQYKQKAANGKAEVFANAIRHDFRSKNPTTRWSDIIALR